MTWSRTRLPERLESTAFARRMEDLRAEAGDDLLDLTVSDPSADFPEARAEMAGYLEKGTRRAFAAPYEPHPLGIQPAREAVAGYYDRRGIAQPIDRLALTASTSEAYTWLAKLLGEPGDALATPVPSYPLFEHLFRLECVEALPYRLAYEGRWRPEKRALERLRRADGLRGIVAVSPNNPTGHVLEGKAFERLADLAVERGVPLIVDEVFGDFPVDREALPSAIELLRDRPPEDRPLLFMLSGLSKLAGLPGAKMSWIAVDGPPERCEEAIERLEFVGDAFLSVTTATQRAAPAVLAHLDAIQEPVRSRLAHNRQAVRRQIEAAPTCTAHPVEGGWYQVLRLPGFLDEAELVVDLLDKRLVALQPGFFYDFDSGAHLVVSLLTPPECFEEGLQRTLEFVESKV